MRKLALLLAALSLIVMAFGVQADGHETIADVVVASTEGEEPEFTVLLAALQAADLVGMFADEDENWTVFAPTDEAFGAALEALGLTAEELLADTATLTDILSYHVVATTLMAEDVVALDGALIGTFKWETAVSVSVDGDAVMINDATVVTADVTASNGVVHVIDTVLLPPTPEMEMDATEEPEMVATEEPEMAATEEPEEGAMDMGSIAGVVITSAEGDEPEFTTLLAAVQAADPSILAELAGGRYLTVFAPTDEAFGAALEALGMTAEELLADTETLTQILAYHVLPGHFAAETVVAVAADGVDIATVLPGTSVAVSSADGVTVNGANVIATDVHATNGIIHVIDAVLLPPSGDDM